MPSSVRYPRVDNIEDLEKYRLGGYHPVSIGDAFAKGRYKVVHKLGFGDSSREEREMLGMVSKILGEPCYS